MLKLSIEEFFFRSIPESFLLILMGYVLSCKIINKRLCVISSILLSLSVYLIRLLPIYYGINTIINIIVYILLLVIVNKIDITKAIPISLIVPIILSVLEWINLIIMEDLFKINLLLVNRSINKVLYFIPSLSLFALITFLSYKIIYKNKKEDSKNEFS